MPHLHLFGGGSLVVEAARIADRSGWGCSLRTSSRLWDENSSVAAALKELGVPVVVADDLEIATQQGPGISSGDLALSFGAPWIFGASWLAAWEGRVFNCHGRRLPRFRGGGGPSWQILMEERTGMACIHQVTPGVDDGPIAASHGFVYPPTAKLPREFIQTDEQENGALLKRWLPGILAGESPRLQPQPEHLSEYWPRLSTDLHGWIDWSWNVDEIVSFCTAFDEPYTGAKTYLRGGIVSLGDASKSSAQAHHPYQSGLIFRVDGPQVHVAAKEGALCFGRVTPQTSELVPRIGDRLHTPAHVLERALATRVYYLPDGTVKQELAAPDPEGPISN